MFMQQITHSQFVNTHTFYALLSSSANGLVWVCMGPFLSSYFEAFNDAEIEIALTVNYK